MKVSVVGSGNMGSGFVKQLAKAGHEVRVTSRHPEKAQALAGRFGAQAVTPAGARESDVLILATAYGDALEALRGVGPPAGQVVVDVTNPLSADYMALTLGHTTSGAEEIAKAAPGVRLVKAFNTVFAQILAEGPDFGAAGTVPVFVAGDDAAAKQTVTTLARSLGFEVIDAGGLKNARYLEPLAGLNIYLGYGAGLGTGIAPTWMRGA